MRNALYTRWKKYGKKKFPDENNVQIGMAVTEEIFQKDRQRELANVAPLSEIQESTVVLNKWSVMNAMEAKRPFSWKTLVAILADLYNELGVPNYERLKVDVHGALGYTPSAAHNIQEVLKKASPEKIASLAPKISSFEWLANVHEMFNATLMNTELLIKSNNIDMYV